MATVFQLKEGVTTTDLNDATNTKLSKYTPAVKNIGDATVTETAVIVVEGNEATLDSVRAGIIKRLYNAHARQNNRGRNRTFIHFQPDGAAAEYRSEILDGRIANEKNAHGEAWGENPMEFSIIWTRRNYWEGAEAQVPLTNTNGADNTAGLNIYNSNDGVGASPNDRVNYCEIGSADVAGDLPGATRIEMLNPYATGNLGYVWIGQNFTDPDNHVWNYEAEDATPNDNQVSADASDGNWNEVALTSDAAFQDKLTWTLSAAALDAAKGGMMKLVMRFFYDGANFNDPARTWWRVKLDANSLPLYISGRSKPDVNYGLIIRDLITFNLPPWLRGETNQMALDFVIQCQQESGSGYVLNCDTMYLIPADGWRYIQTNHYVDTGERLVDDGISDTVYVDDGAGDDKHSACVGYGNAIMLEPGTDQRLYFLMHSTSAFTAEVDRYLTVKVYYRPRRYTI